MFERFTDRSRQVVALAQEESRALDHDYIGTEHILLALISLEGSVSHEALTSCGYTAEPLRASLGRGDKALHQRRDLPFTPRAKKVLELSLREALQLTHREIDDYHLLLGVLRIGECTAISMLVPDGNAEAITRLRKAILNSRRGTPTGDDAAPATTGNAALITQIISRLEGKSETELKSLLDSLG